MVCPHCWGAGSIADEQLSPNFRLSEFLASDTAKEHSISNLPTEEAIHRLRDLARELLQPLRDQFGPIRITSGYRSPILNRAVKGSSTSAHMLGDAADIVPLRASVDEVMAYLPESGLAWDQAIDEGTHIHIARISPAGKQRMQLLVKRGGQHFVWEASDVA